MSSQETAAVSTESTSKPAINPGASRSHDDRNGLIQLLLDELSRPKYSAETEIALQAGALLHDACRERASDIHIDPDTSGYRIRFRIDGVIVDAGLLSTEQGKRVVNQFKALAQIDPVAKFVPEEARFTHRVEDRELEFRVELAPCINGNKFIIRVLEPTRVEQRISELGLDRADLCRIEDWLAGVRGMLLVAGPTGSGKTTSLYALLHELRLLDCSVITIEDPVECQIDGISQIQVDEPHGLTFAEGIKAILRLDPDYMLVGEIRDGSSARAAVDAAATGRTLMSTIHTRDAVGSVTVLRNLGLADHEIAAVMSIIVSQRLVRCLCPHCRVCDPPTEREARWLDTVKVPVPEQSWHAVGCRKCRDIGYRGRTGVFEVWRLDEHDYGLILEHADERSIRDRLCHTDHRFLLADALVKAENGVTSIEELRAMGGFGWTRSLDGSA